jgi:mitogen-activated protein kinase organizer 1
MGKIHVVEFNEDASVVASGMCPFYLAARTCCHFLQDHSIPLFAYGTFGESFLGPLWASMHILRIHSAQSRQAIQVLEEARDAVQTIHVGSITITTGSIDGHVRTYDLRKGELRSDFIGRKVSFLYSG